MGFFWFLSFDLYLFLEFFWKTNKSTGEGKGSNQETHAVVDFLFLFNKRFIVVVVVVVVFNHHSLHFVVLRNFCCAFSFINLSFFVLFCFVFLIISFHFISILAAAL